MKPNSTETIPQTIDIVVPEIDAGCVARIDKKTYTRPVLTRFGKVSRLTAGFEGSNTDTLGGNLPV